MTLKRISLVLLGLIMVLSVAALPVVAQDSDNADSADQSEESDSTDRTRADLQKSLSDRLAEYKQNRSEALSDARESIITQRCDAAQIKITLHKEKVEAAKVRRTTVYSSILDKLSSIITRLDGAGVDTAELTGLVTTANETASQISADLDAYIQVLGDLIDMDCSEDPEGFQAALEAARSVASSLRSDVAAFHTYLKEDVKTAFRDVVSNLNSDAGDSEGEG